MNATFTAPAARPSDTRPRRGVGLILVLEGLLMLVPLVILGATINWPQILNEPASTVLPNIQAQAGGVRLGYTVYLVYSILFFPVMFLAARAVAGRAPLNRSLQVAVGMAALSTLARAIGIIRWLVAMPMLATLYVAGQDQATVRIVYEALNAYGGSIGEVLGVSLFAALSVALVSIALLQADTLPRWLGWLGLLSAVSLAAPLLEIFGIDIGPFIIASVAVVQVWFLVFGLVLIRQARQRGQEAGGQ